MANLNKINSVEDENKPLNEPETEPINKLSDTTEDVATTNVGMAEPDKITAASEPALERFSKLGLQSLFPGSETKVEKRRKDFATVMNELSDEDFAQLGIQRSTAQKLAEVSDDPMDALTKINKIKELGVEARKLDYREKVNDRMERQLQLKTIYDAGDTVTEDDIKKIHLGTGRDLNTTIEMYGIPSEINEKTGERSWMIPPQFQLKLQSEYGYLKPTEIEYLGGLVDASDTMEEVVRGMKELDVKNPNDVGSIVWENIGPFSLPARFDLVGQYAKDPKYTVMKNKLERAFQLYRKAITGAQASYTELQTLRPLIASFKTKPEVFYAVADDLMNESRRLFKRRIQLYQTVGRNTDGLWAYMNNQSVSPTRSTVGAQPSITVYPSSGNQPSGQGRTLTLPSGLKRTIRAKGTK